MRKRKESGTFIRGNFYKHNKAFRVKCHLLEVSLGFLGSRFKCRHVLFGMQDVRYSDLCRLPDGF